MNIAMLGHKAIPSTRGGIETVLTNLCPLLVQRGAAVTCYNRSADQVAPEFLPEIQNKRFRGVRLKKARTLPMRGVSAMLASFTAAIACAFSRYDVVHFHAEGPCAAMFLPKLFGKKCVATVHGLDWQREKWGHGLGSKYIHFGEKMLARHADAVIVLSESAREYFAQTYQRETVVIPNGIARPTRLEANLIQKRFGLSRESYLCLASRLTEEKGVHYLIDAFRRIDTEKKLVICGDSSDTDAYVAQLREMAQDDSRILFTGFLSGDVLAEIYSNAYLVCLPSNIEGMSLSLLEALAYGNAVVCSDIPENTSVCGEYALTFRKGDADDLRDKLEYLLQHEDIKNAYQSRAADYICGRFSWESTADATLALYQTLLQGGKETDQ